MFTGIVEEVGHVTRLEGNSLSVTAPDVADSLGLGDSISVNGPCLTVVERWDQGFRVDLSPETLRRTSLGVLKADGIVNLERALAVSGRLSGHIVQGHVDGKGTITSSRGEEDSVILRVRCPRKIMPYLVEKGFVAVDGISLTVVKKGTSSFTLSIIPYTMAHTNLRDKTVGHRVNLETDIVAKYIESLLDRYQVNSEEGTANGTM